MRLLVIMQFALLLVAPVAVSSEFAILLDSPRMIGELIKDFIN